MTVRGIGRRWLVSIVLGTVAPIVFAQVAGPGGMHDHGRGRDGPEWQDCKKQADDKKIAAGPERRQFMRQCIEAKRGASDAAKGEAAREKMRDPSSGHLHSDPPPASSAPPPSGS